jgi:hypothetical protein
VGEEGVDLVWDMGRGEYFVIMIAYEISESRE